MTVENPRTPKPWVSPQETKENLDWADLVTIDLAHFDKEGGKQKLAKDLDAAIKNTGFFAVINSGFDQEDINEIFGYGQHFFEDYTEEEKKAFEVDFTSGNYFGYKVKANKAFFGTEVRDNTETLNIAKFTESKEFNQYHQNEFIQNHYNKLSEISHRSYEVSRKLFILFAIILELPENYFVDRHQYEDTSDDHVRFMRYFPRSKEDDAKIENIWSRAHTDFGTLTLLFNQVVAGLQIKLENGQWKWIKPVTGGIIVNVGDTLTFWSGGYFKSTVHRVIRAPEDQVDSPRIGSFYFVRPGDNAQVEIADSPLLKRLGLYKKVEPVIGTEYVRSRVVDYHNRATYEKQANKIFKIGQFEIQDGFE